MIPNGLDVVSKNLPYQIGLPTFHNSDRLLLLLYRFVRMVYNKMFFEEDDVPCKRTARQPRRALLTQSEEGANVEDLIDTATMIRLKGT